jgi:hypothetical protein
MMPVVKKRKRSHKTVRLAAKLPRATVKTSITDLQITDTPVSIITTNAMRYYQCFLPTQGVGVGNRYGDRTILKAIKFNLFCFNGATQIVAASPIFVRLVLFWDSQPNGADPTSPMPISTTSCFSMPSADQRYRFTILRDWIMPIAASNQTINFVDNSDNSDSIQRGYISGKNYISQFTASAGAIADVASGALVLGAIGTVIDGGTNTPFVSGTVRCYFSS